MHPPIQSVHVCMASDRKREPEIQVGELVRAVLAVQRMTTTQLRQEVERLTGEPCRSWNKSYLQRKVAGLIQAQARSEEVVRPDNPEAQMTLDASPQRPGVVPGDPASLRVRDKRLPVAGSEIVKNYRGTAVRVRVLEEHFEYQGLPFRSLTALAKAITGQKSISGWLFFGLTRRERRK